MRVWTSLLPVPGEAPGEQGHELLCRGGVEGHTTIEVSLGGLHLDCYRETLASYQ